MNNNEKLARILGVVSGFLLLTALLLEVLTGSLLFIKPRKKFTLLWNTGNTVLKENELCLQAFAASYLVLAFFINFTQLRRVMNRKLKTENIGATAMKNKRSYKNHIPVF